MENVEVKGRGAGNHALSLSKLRARSSAENECGGGGGKLRKLGAIQEHSHSEQEKKSAKSSIKGLLKII